MLLTLLNLPCCSLKHVNEKFIGTVTKRHGMSTRCIELEIARILRKVTFFGSDVSILIDSNNPRDKTVVGCPEHVRLLVAFANGDSDAHGQPAVKDGTAEN